MRRAVLARLIVCVLLVTALSQQGKADSRYDITPTPTWVIAAELDTKTPPASDAHKGGADYVLVDHQIRLDTVESHYARFITRLTNVSGIEDNSQITINFDPKVERLHLHSVVIRRGNQAIDQLKSGRIRVLQRETELADQLVDGTLTFHLVMADVRVGDTVEYSYTLERRNLEWGSRYFGRFRTRWGDPVGFLRIRILARAGSILKTLGHAEETPKAWDASGWSILEWSKADVAAIRRENDAPSWFQQYGAIEYSQFSDWGQIVEAALPLYRITAAPSRELKDLSMRLSATSSSEAERAIAAMKFVQEEIRYTGIEEGEGAFRPTTPNEVLARRYGDCKDKALLAVTLLKALGIDAAPALVSTRWMGEVVNHLPSPGLMNHVVVRAIIAGKTYWFDATVTGQGGRLANFTQARFGQALVIAPGTTALEVMAAPELSKPLIESHSVFDLRAGLFAESYLSVTTKYSDAEADAMRRRLRAKGPAEQGQKYLHYYKGLYSDAQSTGPLQVKDNIEDNELTVVESYRLKDVFDTNNAGKQKFHVHADNITEALDAPDLPERTTPLALDFPNYQSVRIQMLLPAARDVDAEVENIDTPFFHYHSNVGYRDKIITLDYEFKALKDHVPVAQLPEHIKALERARDDTYFHISRQPGTINEGPKDSFLVVKLVALLAGLFLALHLGRYIVTVLAFLAITLDRVRTSDCADDEVPESERTLLMSMDNELTQSQFIAVGFVRHSPLYTRFDKPEFIRVLHRRDLAATAYVSRHCAPEYGLYVRVCFETEMADGTKLQTMDGSFDTSTGASTVLAEAVHGASLSALIKRHDERLKALQSKGVPALASPPAGFAGLVSASGAATRSEWLRKGWVHATLDADLERLTLKGALRFARASIRSYRAKALGHAFVKASMAASSNDREARAAADYLALNHLAKEPRQAPGPYWTLIAYCATWALALLGVLAAISGVFISAVTLAAVLLHESAHVWALRRKRAPTGLLFLLPLAGFIKNGSNEDLALVNRLGVVLAGPLTGLLFAVMLLTVDMLRPNHHLRDAAWIFTVFNGLLLIPFAPADGFRTLAALTSPRAAWRPIAQLTGVVVVLSVGIYLKSTVLNATGFVGAVIFLGQLWTFRLKRRILSQIPVDSNWESAARTALLAMTGPTFSRWRSSIRQMHAMTIAHELTRPTPGRRDQALGAVAYVACAALAIFTALACQ